MLLCLSLLTFVLLLYTIVHCIKASSLPVVSIKSEHQGLDDMFKAASVTATGSIPPRSPYDRYWQKRIDQQHLDKIVQAQKLKQPWQLKKEVAYARARLNRPDLTVVEWNRLIRTGNPVYMDIIEKHNERMEEGKARYALHRHIAARPTDAATIDKVESSSGFCIEEYQRRTRVSQRRHIDPMSNRARTRLMDYIGKLRNDIKAYQNSGILIDGFQDRRMGPVKPQNVDKYMTGDATSSCLVDLIQEIRRIFHHWPLDPRIYPKMKELNEWMKENQRNYLKIVTPKQYYKRKKNKSVDRPVEELISDSTPDCTPTQLDAVGLKAIRKTYSTDAAFLESLFGRESVDTSDTV